MDMRFVVVVGWVGLVGLVGVTACRRPPTATTTTAPQPTTERATASPTAGFHAERPRFEVSERAIRQAVADARAGRLRSFVFEVSTTIGFGCKCPPFVIGSGEAPVYVMPTFGALPDAEDQYLLGEYRMLGRFDGREISAIQWRRETGKEHVPGESDAGWNDPAPAIVVEDWCFEPRWDSLESWEPRAWIVNELRTLHALGRICPGALPAEGELVAAVRAPAPAP